VSRKRILPLVTVERVRELFTYDPETGLFTARVSRQNCPAGTVITRTDRKGYIRFYIDGAHYLGHRLAWLYVYGVWPAEQVDHINHVHADNRLSNLRLCSNAENRQNIRLTGYGASGYLGVTYHAGTGRWMAKITLAGEGRYLGLHDTPEQAHEAYLIAKREVHYFVAQDESIVGGGHQ
jgi:hypothetical protein